jgi:hypothetical protein
MPTNCVRDYKISWIRNLVYVYLNNNTVGPQSSLCICTSVETYNL